MSMVVSEKSMESDIKMAAMVVAEISAMTVILPIIVFFAILLGPLTAARILLDVEGGVDADDLERYVCFGLMVASVALWTMIFVWAVRG